MPPHGGDSHTDHRVSLPSVGTPDLPSPLGHHAWPSIPASIPCALCLPSHTEDLKKSQVPKRSSQRGTGSPTHLQHITPLAVTACPPPSWQPCHLEVISPAVAAEGLASLAPQAGSLSPGGAPGAAPNCSDTLPRPATATQACGHAHTHTYKHTLALQRRGCWLHPACPWDAASTQLPRNCPQPLAGLRHPAITPMGPVPVGVLPPLVLAFDAACLACSGKQEVLGGRDEGLVTPVAGAAAEAGMPGSSSLPSLGSQILAPWPNPAH